MERGDARAAGVAAGEVEARGGAVGERRRARVDRCLGAVVSTVQVKLPGRVGVAGLVGRPDLEFVGAVGERRSSSSARCSSPSRSAVESIRHWKEAMPEPPVSLPEKLKLAVALLESADGPSRSTCAGAVVSTVQVKLGRGRVGVAGLVDRPDFEGVGAVGEGRCSSSARCSAVQSAAWVESIRHWKEATPEPPVSLPEKLKLAAALLESAGGLESIDVVGRGRVDGPGEARPESGRCCRPGRSPGLRICGSRRRARHSPSARCSSPQSAAWVESIRHWKEATPEPPVSLPEKLKLAAALLESAGGLESIEVVRRGRVDGPGEARRRLVGVAGLVDRPDFEFVGAVGEARVALRRAAAPPVGAWVESIRHWKEATPEPPVSLPEKLKLAAALLVRAPAGSESIDVFGRWCRWSS